MDQLLHLGRGPLRRAARWTPLVALALLLVPAVPAHAAGDISQYEGRARGSVMSFTFHVPDAVFPFTIEGGSFDSNVLANSLPQGYGTAGVFPVPIASSFPLLVSSKLPQAIQDALKSIDYTNTPNYCQAVWPPAKAGLDHSTCGGPSQQNAPPAASSATANGHVKTTGDFDHPLMTRSLAESRGQDLVVPTLQATIHQASSQAVSGLNSTGVPQSEARAEASLIELLEGKIKLGHLASHTLVTNDGTPAGRSATSTFSLGSATILDVPVHIGQDGFTVATQQLGGDATKSLTDAINKAASISGFSMRLFPAPPVTTVNGILSAESGGVEVSYVAEKPTPARIIQRFGYTAASMSTLTLASDVDTGSTPSGASTAAPARAGRAPTAAGVVAPTSALTPESAIGEALPQSPAPASTSSGGAADNGAPAGTTTGPAAGTRSSLADSVPAAQSLDPGRVRYLYGALALFMVAVPVLFRLRRAI